MGKQRLAADPPGIGVYFSEIRAVTEGVGLEDGTRVNPMRWRRPAFRRSPRRLSPNDVPALTDRPHFEKESRASRTDRQTMRPEESMSALFLPFLDDR